MWAYIACDKLDRSTDYWYLIVLNHTALMSCYNSTCSGADLCRVLVEAEHLAMEEIMSSIGDTHTQPPVAVVCQRHLETVLQHVSPSVKVQIYFIICLFHCCSDTSGLALTIPLQQEVFWRGFRWTSDKCGKCAG